MIPIVRRRVHHNCRLRDTNASLLKHVDENIGLPPNAFPQASGAFCLWYLVLQDSDNANACDITNLKQIIHPYTTVQYHIPVKTQKRINHFPR